MSNRRRVHPKPPHTVAAYARAYRCHDCDSEVDKPIRDVLGIWRVPIHHDDSCPALNGQVSLARAGIAAAAEVAATGISIAYVTTEEETA